MDPYEKWLGIPPHRRPLNLYDLLGLALFESDESTIHQAAQQRIAKVRRYQDGPHGDQAQKLISQLTKARLILIDADRRAEYDLKLREGGTKRLEATPTSSLSGESMTKPGTTPEADPLKSLLDSIVVPQLAIDSGFRLRPSPTRSRSRLRNIFLAVTGIAAHAAMFGGAYILFANPWNWKLDRILEQLNQLLRNNHGESTRPVDPRPEGKKKESVASRNWLPRKPITGTQPSEPQQAVVHPEPEPEPESIGGNDANPKEAKSGGTPGRNSRFAPNSPEELLSRNGLELEHSFYVLQGEHVAEQKLLKLRSIFNQYSVDYQSWLRIMEDRANLKQLNMDITSYSHDITELELDRQNFLGRNNVHQQQRAIIDGQLLQLKRERNEAVTNRDQIRNRQPQPREFDDLLGRIWRLHGECSGALEELRRSIDSTDVAYDSLAKRLEVKDAIRRVGEAAHVNDKLGPSDRFKAIRLEMKRIESDLKSSAGTVRDAGN